MLEIKEEELKKILPSDGPSIDEVKRYLEKYNDEYIVIKCGGSVLVDKNLFDIFIKDISVLNKLGFIPIIVHGGGKRISNKLNEMGIKSEFVKGLRVTSKEIIEVVEKVLIDFNKEIIEALQQQACNSQTISSKQNNIITVAQESADLGFVGTPQEKTKMLQFQKRRVFLPPIFNRPSSSVGHNRRDHVVRRWRASAAAKTRARRAFNPGARVWVEVCSC